MAALLVLTKTDLAADAAGVGALLRPLAPRAAVTRAVRGNLPITIALGEHGDAPRAAPHPARHDADFATLTLHPTAPVDPARLCAVLDAAPDGLLRAKGILPLVDGTRILVQRVGRRLELLPHDRAAPEALVLLGTGVAPWGVAEMLRPLGLKSPGNNTPPAS